MRKLVTFLGNPRRPSDASSGRYVTTSYRFEGDWDSGQTAFFGLALFDWLRHVGRAPDELVVMGTSGSIWDALYALTERGGAEEHLEAELELIEAVEASAVTREHLDRVQEALSEHLEGVTIHCVLISSATGASEQRDILAALARPFSPGDEMILDITHGFRHVGLLAIQGAQFLRQAWGVELGGVYYGMFGATPRAVALEDVEPLVRWTEALTIFRRTGNLGQLPDLFRAHHPQVATPLARLHYTMSINAFDRAHGQARQARIALDRLAEGDDTLAGYIADQLARELGALFAGDHIADWQRRLARRALEARDFMRAVILLYESIVSEAIGDEQDRMNRHARNAASTALGERDSDAQSYFTEPSQLWTFLTLRFIRNDVAHGSNPQLENTSGKNVQNRLQTLRDGDALTQFLEECFDVLEVPARALRHDPPF